ncbi:fimbrillin family protein [Parabacteroides sp. PF5-9]|uniref:BF2992 family fimbrillin-A clan protein n=1 Tax=Parabacteroides sp. PF5-9 TaxID=1742404 RepID=UPI0024757A42|nr:fimbrillin family protein [Parabacteroides sp. PF5-9]
MKRLYTYFERLIIGCCLLVTGCTYAELEGEPPTVPAWVELRFEAAKLESSIISRTTTRAGQNEPVQEGTTVRIAAYYKGKLGEYNSSQVDYLTTPPDHEATYRINQEGKLIPCIVDLNGNVIESAEQAKGLYVREGGYDFYAISPARPLVQGTKDNRWQTRQIPHKEDVMTSYATNIEVKAKSLYTIPLAVFQRKCAQVVFHVQPSDKAENITHLKGSRLEMTQISSAGAFLWAGVSQQIAMTGSDPSSAGRVVLENFEPVAEGADPNGLGLNKATTVVLPKNGDPFKVAITVGRNSALATLQAKIERGILFEPGKRYVFTLEVGDEDTSRLFLRILPWNRILIQDDNVGGPGGSGAVYEPQDPDINEGVGTTFMIAQWSHIDWSGDVGGEN